MGAVVYACRMRGLIQMLLWGALIFLSSCQSQLSATKGPRASRWGYPQSYYRPTSALPQAVARPTNSLIPPRALQKPRTPAPVPTCAAVCVIDPRTGNVLYQYNAHMRRQVASTQKLMTALCVTDAGNLNKPVTIAAGDGAVPPIKLGLKPGTQYRRGDLLRAMLTGSYNDLAITLARDTAGSVPAFMRRVNARARRMRMLNSHFVNPNGLPAEQYSTAYDMALAACYAYNNATIRRCINIPEYQFRMADGTLRTIKSTNKLLSRYAWVQGMKTGYTNAAGKCLISCAALNGQSVIVVILGSTNSRVWDESMRYLRWAFGLPPQRA